MTTWRSGTSTSRRCRSTMSRTWSSSRHTSRPPGALMRLPTDTVPAACTLRLAACTRPHSPMRPSYTPTPFSWGRAKIPGRDSSRTSGPVIQPGATPHSIGPLLGVPPIRRDLIRRHKYLVPNSIVVSRGCPHVCDFCYKVAFFKGGKEFYTQTVDAALAEIDRLPGRHLYFLDDHLFGSPPFAEALFDGMRGMNRLWQAAGTVKAVLEQPRVIEKAVACGLRSLFVGFETVNSDNLQDQRKYQNIGRDYSAAVRRLRDLGVMVNGSFVFGMDHDGPDVFERTVDWAIEQGIETATVHILTPYPDTALYQRMQAENRMLHSDWDLYDTRHVVFKPARLTGAELVTGYWQAYRDFYRWGSILRGAATKEDLKGRMRHIAYAGGWKKFEPLWDLVIRSRQTLHALPLLEAVLAGGSASS